MKRYKVKFSTKVLKMKFWAIWDKEKQDFVRDNINLIISSSSKSYLEKLVKVLNKKREICSCTKLLEQ